MKISDERGEEMYQSAGKVGCWTVLIFLICLILSFFTLGNMFFVVLTILTALVLFVCVLIQKIVDKQHNAIMEKHHEAYEAEKKQKEDERQKELENAKILEFYDQCVKENVFDLNTEKSNQKAILIHNRLGLTTNYTDAFSIGKSMREDKKVEAREALLLELRVKENQDYQQSIKYSSCIGRDKEISMLNDLIAPYRAKFAEIAYEQNNATDSYVKGPTLESKASPTIVGGAVSALAGGTAGVIAAINTEQENKQITNRNVEAIDANHKLFIMRTTLLADKKVRIDRELKPLEEKLEKAKIKLVELSDEKEILRNMSFSDINITFSETGSVKIRVCVKLKERFTIFENTPAIADGTIKAEIYQHEQCVGTALLTAPIDGIDTSFGLGTRLEGVILSDNNTAKRYERYYVKFSPYHLWKIEV